MSTSTRELGGDGWGTMPISSASAARGARDTPPTAAGAGDEGGEPLQQLQGIQEERGGAIGPGTPEVVQQAPARALRQPVERQRRAHEVANQALELIPSARAHRDIRMETEALQPGRTPPGRRHGDRRPEPPHWLPGARAERDPALERGRYRLREQRRLRRERVAPGVVLPRPAAARQEAPHAAMHAHQKRRHVGIGRWRQPVEPGPAGRGRARVDGAAISILTGNVVLDLNGSRLRATSGPSTLAPGVLARRGRVTVRNGTIQELTPAVSISPLADEVVSVVLIEDIVADRSRGAGISVSGRYATVRRNRVVLTGRRITSQEDDPTFRGIRVSGRGHRVLDNDVEDMRIAPSDSLAIQVPVGGHGRGGQPDRVRGAAGSQHRRVDRHPGRRGRGHRRPGGREPDHHRVPGVLYAAGATGKFRDNLTSNVAAPYTGGTDAGNNQ
jgi:hypothetical protein